MMGFQPQNPNHGSQDATVLLEMGSFLNCNKNFSRYLLLLLDFLYLSCENLFMMSLFSTNVLLK